VDFATELPKTPSGKIRRAELRAYKESGDRPDIGGGPGG
jgi:acyl-coenzyme A synthetase/AMP-(fatty) acid ligase